MSSRTKIAILAGLLLATNVCNVRPGKTKQLTTISGNQQLQSNSKIQSTNEESIYANAYLHQSLKWCLIDSLTIQGLAILAGQPRAPIDEAECLAAYGKHAQAITILNQYLGSLDSNTGKDRLARATVIIRLSDFNRGIGQYLKAEQQAREALTIMRDIQPSPSSDIARALNSMGLVNLYRQEYQKAFEAFQEGLSKLDKDDDSQREFRSYILSNLGVLLAKQGKNEQARGYIEQALLEGKGTGGQAMAANDAFALAILEKRVDEAGKLLPSIKAIGNANNLGLGDATLAYNTAAHYYYNDKQPDKVLSYTERGLDIQFSYLYDQLPYLPEDSQRSALKQVVESQGSAAEWLFWWATKVEAARKTALETRINRQGLLQDIERRQSLIAGSNASLRKAMDDLRMINISLSSNGLSEGQYAEAVQQQQLMQQLLQSQLPGLALRKISIREVAMALPKDGILIEFQKYREFTSDFAGPGKEWGGDRYLAFILSPEQKVTVVELGPSSRIDDEINAAISASSANNSDAEVRWSKVSKSVLGPVLPYIRNQAQIFISPDAELHKIPFSAILLEEKIRSIIDSSVQLRLLSSGRDLVRLATPAKAGKASMVIASPDFDAHEELVNTGKSRSSSAGRRSTQGLPRLWTALPNSLYEGKSVAALLNARLVTGHAATTRAIQSQDSPRILHIASHGNFVTESHGARDSSNSVPNSHDRARGFNGSVDPLISSYVVLAGANSSGIDPTDDGLLTALEATSLQLNGTELVALSACSTAQGNLQSGEGLYGMQRAFMVAGARSTLLSLWKVDDAATAEFMIRYYNRLKAGEGRADALAAVQREFRNGTAGNGQWKEPFYWAAWQLVGDWRPIQGL